MSEPELTYVGSPLSRINFPNVQTKLPTSQTQQLPLGYVKSEQAVTPQFTQIEMAPTVGGFSLDIGQTVFQFEEKEDMNKLPTTFKEAYEKRKMISLERASKTNPVYGIKDLQQIARNLGIKAKGGKTEMVEQIRKAVGDYMNLPLD